MATKKEYKEALNRMEESYYNLDNSISAIKRFSEDIHLLTGLVNEHFEEKQETNYEHFKDEIIEVCSDELAISKGKAVKCCAIPCSECDFKDKNGHCIGNHEIMKWLKQPYKKSPYKLSRFEFDLINAYDSCKECCLLNEIEALKKMREKGYFNGIDPFTKVHDIIDNCEAV